MTIFRGSFYLDFSKHIRLIRLADAKDSINSRYLGVHLFFNGFTLV